VPGNTYDGMELHYDPKLGFLLYSVTMFSSGIYVCHAEYYDKKSRATYQIVIMRKAIYTCLVFILIGLTAFGFRVYFT